MKTNIFCVIALVVFSSSFLPHPVPAQITSSGIKDRKISIKADNAPPGKVFHQLIYELGIPIGFEKSLLDKDSNDFDFETNLPAYVIRNRQPAQSRNGSLSYEVQWERVFTAKEHFITLDFENAPIERVFDSIVRQMSNYKWEIADDVINIYPKDGRDPRFIELLDIEVHEFILGEVAPLGATQTELYDLPEFKKFLEDRNLAVTGVRYDAQDLMSQMPHGIKLSNAKLKEILNKLAKVKGGGWILRLDRRASVEGKEFIEIDI